MIGLGTPLVLLAEQLGASTFQVGLASSFVFLLLPVQVLSTAALGRLGFKRQMMMGWWLRALFLLIPAALAWAAPAAPRPWMVNLLVASVFFFCLLRAFGSAGHIPWFAAILPPEVRGRFWATDGAITSGVGVATLLSCAALFAHLPPYEAFQIVYGLAMLGSLFAVASLARLPAAPAPAQVPLRRLPREARRLCLRPGLFRFYLGLSLLGAVVTAPLQSFSVYYLKVEAGLAPSRILVLTAAHFAGVIFGGWAIRTIIDRAPIRRLFQLSNCLIAAVDLFWLGLVLGQRGLAPALPLAFFTFGLASGVANAAHLTLLPDLAPEAQRPVAISVFTAVLGLLAGFSPMLWGLVLRPAGPEPGVDLNRFAAFFGLGAALCALLLVLFERLEHTRRPGPHAAD